ncbi:RPAP1-like protein [Protomyces lactucae-debilis]|uniref:RPAP1-like protein n=1 Tax=Protomyces lactucae-debilis TaxID=2754530 RepID=A0A1Y2FK05_PROLT|nr:RPAP1-like protein [Protomyces lactucae-debilis]ORY84302.1 RPAP1-like protein [Protomyces lactucae-debilis]
MADTRKPSRFKLSRDTQPSQDPALPGHRITIDLESSHHATSGIAAGDILERNTDGHAVSLEQSTTVKQPLPKKIDWRARATSRRTGRHETSSNTVSANMQEPGSEKSLAAEIERENMARVAGMSPDALKMEQEALLAKLDPSVVAVLRRRAARKAEQLRVETQGNGQDDDDVGEVVEEQFVNQVPTLGTANGPALSSRKPVLTDSEAHEQDIISPAHVQAHESTSCTHFPARALDPASVTFLDDLKENYFPNLAHDPSKLQWMQPATDAEDTAQYHPATSDSVAPGEIRFGFSGELLAPLASRQVDTALGLHHHADAPRAAGYTLLELALLARSTQPSQASLAIRTLGRVVYRLHHGEFGEAMTNGLMAVVKEARVMETLMERSRDAHLSVANYAMEALWQANLEKPAEKVHAV